MQICSKCPNISTVVIDGNNFCWFCYRSIKGKEIPRPVTQQLSRKEKELDRFIRRGACVILAGFLLFIILLFTLDSISHSSTPPSDLGIVQQEERSIISTCDEYFIDPPNIRVEKWRKSIFRKLIAEEGISRDMISCAIDKERIEIMEKHITQDCEAERNTFDQISFLRINQHLYPCSLMIDPYLDDGSM